MMALVPGLRAVNSTLYPTAGSLAVIPRLAGGSHLRINAAPPVPCFGYGPRSVGFEGKVGCTVPKLQAGAAVGLTTTGAGGAAGGLVALGLTATTGARVAVGRNVGCTATGAPTVGSGVATAGSGVVVTGT